MDNLLELMKAIVPLLQTVLWIGVILGTAYVFRNEIGRLKEVLAKRIEQGAAFSVGPVQFGELRSTVIAQGGEIGKIEFLISHMLPVYEYDHLRRLSGDQPVEFERNDNFENEMRHLRNIRFIEHRDNTPFGIRKLPQRGDDLRKLFRVTEGGMEYLKLRSALDVPGPDPQAESADERD